MRPLSAQPGGVQGLEPRLDGRGIGVERGRRLRVAAGIQPVPAEVGVGRDLVNRGEPRKPARAGEQGERLRSSEVQLPVAIVGPF